MLQKPGLILGREGVTNVFNKKTRTKDMSHIKAKNTNPQLIIRKAIHNRGFRYRLHEADLPGKPEIVLAKYNAVVQINGCFWHGHINREACGRSKISQTGCRFVKYSDLEHN